MKSTPRPLKAVRTLLVVAAAMLSLSACSGDENETSVATTAASVSDDSSSSDGSTSTDAAPEVDFDEASDVGVEAPTAAVDSDYLGAYSVVNEEFGTRVTVAVDRSTRTIQTNALPDHDTGEFPNQGNPNTISEQDRTWEFPLVPTVTGTATGVRVPGVAVNGIKFEPDTAETVSCATGETLRVEALQDVVDLGIDFNNAHVQPTGEYHYHGVSELLVDAYETDADLVHVGFAGDGHLIYYSKSGAYASSYALSAEARTGTDCEISLPNGDTFDLDGTSPDGTYTSDWVYTEGSGDLDQCNGITIDGQYAYLMTDTFPYVSRCLMGEPSADAGTTGGPGGGGPPPGR